jgi:hypothetical protein
MLFSTALFGSAFLLFWVQPLIAKMILPLLGGTPGVWNTSMVFFQAVLLGGYFYAHLLSSRLPPRRQMAVHFTLLAVALAALPVAVPKGWEPPPDANPALWVVMILGLSVGLPTLVISATAPLLQHWFFIGRHDGAEDPYFLYTASNAGSIAALLGFPLLIEPRLRLVVQSWSWTGAYVMLGLVLAACAMVTLRHRQPAGRDDRAAKAAATGAPDAGIPGRTKARWLLLALVPSSLLLGTTTHITTDIAAVPLLWVIPLGLYLLSFVIVFARRPLLPHRWMLAAQPFVILPLVAVFALKQANSLFSFPLHLLALFTTAMVCHGELAAARPPARHLTSFYLWMSLGGVAGGLCNALIAPLVFPGVWEYPLVIVLSLALRPSTTDGLHRRFGRLEPAVALLIPAVVGGLLWGLKTWAGIAPFMQARPWVTGVAAGAAWILFRKRALALTVATGGLIVAGLAVIDSPGTTLLRERNFFGVITISREQNRFHVFKHGRIVHGAQELDPGMRGEPLTYFTRTGPLGMVFATSTGRHARRNVAVIGLGAGTIAAYGEPGQRMTFYEIDPDVIDIARRRDLFSFLADSRASIDTVAGDARLTLAKAPDASFDLIVIDAFSSDSIPVHIITREAFDLYASKLAPGGILAANISNAYLDLAPVLVRTAQDLGWSCIMQIDTPRSAAEQLMSNRMNSRWVVMARQMSDMGWLPTTGKWTKPVLKKPIRPWTDDYANVLGTLQMPKDWLKLPFS